jgi:ubiquinone biosynthesis protein
MARTMESKSEALLLMRALRNGAEDKTSSKRLKEIIGILWRHQVYRGTSPEKVVAVMEDLGPTFVKVGQIMSGRRDIFPEEYCEAFGRLRTEATPLSFAEIEARLNEVYDGDYTKVFRQVNRNPLGSASVAQVHKGVLRHGGDAVAIKVQRPGIKKQMTDDVELLRRANDLLKVSAAHSEGMEAFDISAFVGELERTVKDEIDFRREAQNLRDFRNGCADVEGVTSPRVYDDLTSETVLVMEYVEGAYIDDREALGLLGVEPGDVARSVTQDYIRQLLTDGLFHADPHVGNIIVKPGFAIEWIDLGMVGRLTLAERQLLRKMFLAVGSRDAQEMKNVLLTWGRPVGEVNHSKLLQEVDAMLARYASDSIVDIDVVAAVNDLLSLIRGQGIAMPPSFTMLARGIVTLEATIEAVSPETSIIGAVNEYLKAHLLDDFDLEQEFQDLVFSIRKLSHKVIGVPSQVSDLLDMLAKGEMRVQVAARDLEKPISKLGSTIDRMTLGMITAGLFIGSSMLCTTAMEPRILGIPLIGFLGYMGALLLSIYIVVKGRP